jgi:hypothetical protein
LTLKKRITQPESRSTADLFGAVGRLGELIESYPLHVLDVSSLPMPKQQMKTALREAWCVAKPDRRRAIEIGYAYLANFQIGVGWTPTSPALAGDRSQLHENIAWMKRASDEMEVLRKEFDAFKRPVK